MIKEYLENLLNRVDLSQEQAKELLAHLLDPAATHAQISAVLIALRAKGETAAELAGFAQSMREAAIDPLIESDPARPTLDIVGTGGDNAGTLNISTSAALLVAAASHHKLRVVKHGNRAISSQAGSADVLAALGLPIPLGPSAARKLLAETGFTFLFAPHYHPATSAVQQVRRSLGVRTIFNMLGPLTNPARPNVLVIGAFSSAAASLMSQAASRLAKSAVVVHTPQTPTTPGIDELTSAVPAIELSNHGSTSQTLHAESFGFQTGNFDHLRGKDASFNASAIRRAFQNTRSTFLDSVEMTAALALKTAGVAKDYKHGVAIVQEALCDGHAQSLLHKLSDLAPTLEALNNQDARTLGTIL